MVRQAVPLQPREVHGGADLQPQPMEDPMPEQVDVPSRKLQPMESPSWTKFAGRSCRCGEEHMYEQVFWQDLWPVGDPSGRSS